MFSRIALTSGSLITKIAKNGLNQQSLVSVRTLKTKTWALVGNEIKEVEVETTVTPFNSPCTPSTQEKIYPTAHDNYEGIPVVIDGKEVFVTRMYAEPSYPIIPNVAPPGVSENKIDPSQPGETMADVLDVHFAENMPTIHDDKKPERDLVNYPAWYADRPIAAPRYHMTFFPEWWFEPFYRKTGVTGPYVAVSALFLTGLSKEWLIIDHSVPGGICFWLILGIIIKKYGAATKTKVMGSWLKTAMGWNDWKEGSIKFLRNTIEFNNKQMAACKENKVFFDALRENVHLQREAVYRNRLMAVYQEAKRKLDFQIALDEAKKQFAQRYMVNWVIDNVHKSLTPDKEKSYLEQCIADLKELSVKRANYV